MLTQGLPLLPTLSTQSMHAELQFSTDFCRHSLTHLRSSNLHQLEGLQWNCHTRLAGEGSLTTHVHSSTHAGDGVGQVVSDLEVGFSAVEVEVSQKVVMEGEELQVEFGQGGDLLAIGRYKIIAP